MEIRLLGAVEVVDGDRVFDCGPPQQRHVLAVLAATVGRPVTPEALIDRVWDEAPAGARRTLHVYVNGLRRLFGESLPRRSGGYVLDIDPDRVDVHRFSRLVGRARDGAGTWREAVALWRGEPLAGLPGQWAERTREAWRREYVDAVLAWAEVEIAAGNAGAVVGQLTELTGEYPLMEPLAVMLMRALYASGRAAEALDHYAKVRRWLADQLGTDPGEELQHWHRAILRGDRPDEVAGPPVPLAPDRPGPVTAPPPAQLPADAYGFTGRTDQLKELDRLLDRTGDRPNAVVISALSGTAGVGKTALAVHWAHRVTAEFPDGQLYVNLRGFDPGGTVMTPADAVRMFLGALGVPPERVPPSLDAQAGLYRSLLSGKRMLVVLDNARDAEQVRPLLPGTPTALAVVTSRNLLTGLVAANGAHPLTLDLLSTVESRELLVRRLGTDRVAADPRAVEDVVAACARLPLALTIAAARAQQTGVSFTALATELREAGERLDALDAGDPLSQVRAVFSWSYRTLSPAAARLFRLLGLHAGPDISLPAVASLAGLPAEDAGALLVELTRASLIVTPQVPGRYTFHDLLRAYAAELALQVDPEADRREAVARVLDHYVQTGYIAALQLQPTRDPIGLGAPRTGVVPEQPQSLQEALDWFAGEQAVLIAALEAAAEQGFQTQAWQLTWALYDFLYRRGQWNQWAHTGEVAVAAAERLGDPIARARARFMLSGAYNELDRFDEAEANLHLVVALYRESGDLVWQGHAHNRLAYMWGRRDRHDEALIHAREAVECYRAAGHQAGLGGALNSVCWHLAHLGEYAEALASGEDALRLAEAVNDKIGIGMTADSLGFACHQLGRHADAIAYYERALEFYRDYGDRYGEADALTKIAEEQLASGDATAARQTRHQALTIFTEIEPGPDPDAIRARLEALD